MAGALGRYAWTQHMWTGPIYCEAAVRLACKLAWEVAMRLHFGQMKSSPLHHADYPSAKCIW